MRCFADILVINRENDIRRLSFALLLHSTIHFWRPHERTGNVLENSRVERNGFKVSKGTMSPRYIGGRSATAKLQELQCSVWAIRSECFMVWGKRLKPFSYCIYLVLTRDHDLWEHIPHTWASSHDNLFQSNFSAWSSRKAILGTTPDWPT